jgi:hypothetical protein
MSLEQGSWHQFGWISQKQVIEQLEKDAGVGVIISPRDLSYANAIDYCEEYRDLGASVLVDPQFYRPGYTNRYLESYPLRRNSISTSKLSDADDSDISLLATEIEKENQKLGADGILSPSVIYEAGVESRLDINLKLFRAAKKAGDSLGVPTYASVVIGNSATKSLSALSQVLAPFTSLDCDGFYLIYEFDQNRIPDGQDEVARFGHTCVTLAATGKPVLHGFAGPMAPLSLAFGASGVGIGHFQNLWQFDRERFEDTDDQGGGGNAPSRFFSKNLWGTIIWPDELARLPKGVYEEVLTTTDFSTGLAKGRTTTPSWSRHQSGKHFVNLVCEVGDQLSSLDIKDRVDKVESLLSNSISLHKRIAQLNISLKTESQETYQSDWIDALKEVASTRRDDYDYIDLLSSL